MIVSASYRTDIPAYYGDWFRRRLEAGQCRVASPYGGKPSIVRLRGPGCDGFVFWTRNFAPFMRHLPALDRLGLPFVVQFTVTGYPKALEAAVPPPAKAAEQIRRIADRYGPRAVVWRYDPVVFTTLTPPAWHVENFAALAASLRAHVDEAVVSFVDAYRKTRRNIGRAAALGGFSWRESSPEENRAFIRSVQPFARRCGMALTLCTEDLTGVPAAKCIDSARLGDVAGRPIAARVKGNRPGCLCDESRDIGAYDSCAQGCAYCYAVSDPAKARAAVKRHDPAAELLSPR